MALRYRIRITASVNKELYAQLKEVSNISRIPISKLIDEGMQYVISKYEKKHQD